MVSRQLLVQVLALLFPKMHSMAAIYIRAES